MGGLSTAEEGDMEVVRALTGANANASNVFNANHVDDVKEGHVPSS